MELAFNTIHEAAKYVREMSVEATEQIGNLEVWKHDSGAIFIGSAEALIEAEERNDEWRLVGLVREVLY